MSRATEESNRLLLRARDAMDRSFAQPLDVPALARIACVSEAHFIRRFRTTFGETPHRYLQRRRVERSMFLLRDTDLAVTEVCVEVGFGSLGTFSRTFRDIVGETPTGYRERARAEHVARMRVIAAGAVGVPSCFAMRWVRPSTHTGAPPPVRSFGEADAPRAP